MRPMPTVWILVKSVNDDEAAEVAVLGVGGEGNGAVELEIARARFH